MAIIPVAKSLYLCDYHVRYNDKVDLYGLFNSIRAANGFPHVCPRFCVFTQLNNGLGDVQFYLDVRHAATDELVRTTNTRELTFPNRRVLVQLALTIEGCRFNYPGLYVVSLFCDNSWVCDTEVLLHDSEG